MEERVEKIDRPAGIASFSAGHLRTCVGFGAGRDPLNLNRGPAPGSLELFGCFCGGEVCLTIENDFTVGGDRLACLALRGQ